MCKNASLGTILYFQCHAYVSMRECVKAANDDVEERSRSPAGEGRDMMITVPWYSYSAAG